MTKEIKLTENGEVSSSVVLLMKGCLFFFSSKMQRKGNERGLKGKSSGSLPQILGNMNWKWKDFRVIGPSSNESSLT